MAREFKAFDKKYASFAGSALNMIESKGFPIFREDIAKIESWPQMYAFTEDYAMSTIAFAVYKAPDAEEWQKFRVSLKGLSTREKLCALNWYWIRYVIGWNDLGRYQHNIIRVNNYLGALKRSGHLDSNLRVAKP